MSNPILIQGGRIVDPATERDEVADLFVQNGMVAAPPAEVPADTTIFNASGLTITPGLIDMHVHLREPGREEAETIETGSQAAARGGFTTVVAMPNTSPPLDTAERVAWIKQRGDEVGLVHVYPSACITSGRTGDAMGNLDELAAAGAVAFTDDGGTVNTREVMQQAMEKARELGIMVMDHAEDMGTHTNGVMHEGRYSTQFGLPGIPSAAEARTVLRDAELAEATGAHVHIQHVSSSKGIDIIRSYQNCGVRITGELTPHHLTLTDADVDPEDASYKMNPPLRSKIDQASATEAILDGTLGAFATDHAPHVAALKAKGFVEAPFGIVGLETAVGVTYTSLVSSKRMDLPTWVRRWTVGPAELLGLQTPSLAVGAPADIAVLDLTSEWTVDPERFLSRSRNTPFGGWNLVGQAVLTILDGRITWQNIDSSRGA